MTQNSRQGRHLTVWTASSFVVASMVGTGVFTSLGYQLKDIQSVFPLLMLWIIGGVVALCGALSYSELGAALPRSGGEYYFLSRIIHPSIGFAAGIISATVGFSAPLVLAAMALGSYFSTVFPVFKPMVVALIVIFGFHGLHMSQIKWGTMFQDGSTAVKIGLILIFISFGFIVDTSQSISIFPKPGDGSLLLSSGFAVSLVWVSYAYTGWNSAVYVSGEIMDQQKNIPRAMLMGTAFVMFMYVLLNYIFLRTTPMADMVGKVEVGYIAGNNIFGNVGAKIMGLGISVLLLSTISSFVYIGPRIMQVMGEDHEFIGFLKIKNKHGIPLNAFWIQLAFSMLFLFTSTFEQVLMYAGISLILTTGLTVAALFVLRVKEPQLDRPYTVWGYPIPPLIYLTINIWILYYTFCEHIMESLVGVGIMTISFVLFYIGRSFQTSR